MTAHVCTPETQRLVQVTELPHRERVAILGKQVFRRYCTDCPAQAFVFKNGAPVHPAVVSQLARNWS